MRVRLRVRLTGSFTDELAGGKNNRRFIFSYAELTVCPTGRRRRRRRSQSAVRVDVVKAIAIAIALCLPVLLDIIQPQTAAVALASRQISSGSKLQLQWPEKHVCLLLSADCLLSLRWLRAMDCPSRRQQH